MNTRPSSVVSSSMTATAPGWPTLFATYPSRKKRARASPLRVSSGWSTFTAPRFPFRCVAA